MGPDRDDADGHPTELVIVAGHGTYLGSGTWILAPYQAGEEDQLVLHAKTGVDLVAAAPARRLLVFSGGVTTQVPGAGSEAAGYERVCSELTWFGHPEVSELTYLEEYARDSFENVLYSICRFHEVTGEYPQVIHAVSWGFKAERFDMHRRALRFPAPAWHFHGTGRPVDAIDTDLQEARTRRTWREDPYGASLELAGKRARRNLESHRDAYATACPELAGLLAHVDPSPYGEELPWA